MLLNRPAIVAMTAAAVATVAQAAPLSSPSVFSGPSSSSSSSLSSPTKYHPIVIWHGLGDAYNSPPMLDFIAEVKKAYPGIFIHSISIAEATAADQRASFFGDALEQSDEACRQISAIPELSDGFDAIGFSQGGQFIRGLIERCDTAPPARNLVTFGAQHQGIARLPLCGPTDWLCKLSHAALQGGVWTSYAQSHVIPAQYMRDPKQIDQYLAANHFLTDINNELEANESYAKRLSSLENFVMIMWDEEQIVEPKESGWFEAYPDAPSGAGAREGDGDGEYKTIPLRESDIYLEDRIGLKALDKRGGLTFELCHGGHMQLTRECLDKVFGKYLAVPPPRMVGKVVEEVQEVVEPVVETVEHSLEDLVALVEAALREDGEQDGAGEGGLVMQGASL